jgi:DNA-binding CsgD family transcriptional regulator
MMDNRVLFLLPMLLMIGCVHHKTAFFIVPANLAGPAATSSVHNGLIYEMDIASLLPRWAASDLGRFEEQEIAAIRADILACDVASSDEQFLDAVEKLESDVAVYHSVDESLGKNEVAAMGLLRPPNPRGLISPPRKPIAPRLSVFTGAEYREKALSPRQREALLGACHGLSNKEIASAMHTTEQTIKNQMSSVYARLKVPNRSAAIAYAFRQGWIT